MKPTVLVTAAFSPLGEAICRQLDAAGYHLAMHTRDPAQCDPQAMFDAPPAQAPVLLGGDLGSTHDVRRVFQDLSDQVDTLFGLVNNAGRFLRKDLTSTTREDVELLMESNVVAPLLCMRHAVKAGVTSIVNLVDIASEKSWKHHGAYVASKSALAALTRVAAVEFAPRVRVNGVSPGLVTVPPGMEDQYSAVERRIPLKRSGEVEEIAQAVEMLLAGPQYLTGQVVPVDGGLSLR